MSEQTNENLPCTKCGEIITGKAMKAGENHWHEQHFVCCVCGIRLRDAKVYQRDGNLYCDNDYKMKFLPRCADCCGFILKECIRALNQTWHPEHFSCYGCQAPLGQGQGFHEYNSRPFCKPCYINTACDKCFSCKRPITDKTMKALDKTWHVACFRCKECGLSFEGKKNFYRVEGEPVCGKCIGTSE